MKIAYICEFCGEIGTYDRMLSHEEVCSKNPNSETVFLEEKLMEILGVFTQPVN